MTTSLTYREAVSRAIAAEMELDPTVILLGEDVGRAGGVFKATDGLFDQFGSDRVMDTPIAEQAIIGCALGAAVSGLRPIAEIMFADFAGVCFDQLANQVAKYRYQTNGQATVPLTVRMAGGGSIGFGAQHSQNVENWFLNIPGLKLCVPSNPSDLYHLTRAAIRDDNPVIVFEHKALYAIQGDLSDDHMPPLGTAHIVRTGSDITVVASQLMCHRALDAAETLSQEGIELEVIDPRTIAPLDLDTILTSLSRTGRLMCVEEAPAPGSWGQAVISTAAEQGFELFDAPPRLVAADSIPVPYAKPMEDATLPSVSRIVAAARGLTDQ